MNDTFYSGMSFRETMSAESIFFEIRMPSRARHSPNQSTILLVCAQHRRVEGLHALCRYDPDVVRVI